MSAVADTPDYAFPALAAVKLREPDSGARLKAASTEIEKALAGAAPDARGTLLYSQGLLLRASGRKAEAEAAFAAGSKAPDRGWSQYLNLLAMRETAAGNQ